MNALIPLLQAAAPAAVTAFSVGVARGAGGAIGKGAGQYFSSVLFPGQDAGQKRFVAMSSQGPIAKVPPQPQQPMYQPQAMPMY